jgi:hypothetical protein
MFKLMETFSITAEMLFSFVWQARQAYNNVTYHNWGHVVRALQFLAYEVFFGNMPPIFKPRELLLMFVAILCHDLDHNGFGGTYTQHAEKPLAVLFKENEVMEVHHCDVAIGILTRNECNLFKSFPESELGQLWRDFVGLILATGMHSHFEHISEMGRVLEDPKRWAHDDRCRYVAMKIMVKAADLSDAARKFHVTQKYSQLVGEEYWREGPLDYVDGLVYRDDIHDRDHIDREKSSIPFYMSVCVPLFDVLGRAFPALATMADQVGANVREWHEIEQEKLEEERRAEEDLRNLEELEKKIDNVVLPEDDSGIKKVLGKK